jgi:hypothetical protein
MKQNVYIRFYARIVLISAAVCFLFSGVSAQNQAKWNPKKTWVFFVSLLEWKNAEDFEPFPKENRKDLVLLNVLKQKGVPETQIVGLKDRQATNANIQSSFKTFLGRVPADGWILIYYSGHGYQLDSRETYFASYDAGITSNKSWAAKSIPASIELYSKSRHAVIMIDSCYSGAVADAVKNRRPKVSYAVFASTLANSSSTGNWTFTESLIYGFRGDASADRNRDGKINFGELKQNSYDDMLFAEEQLAQTILTGDFTEQSEITLAKKTTAPRVGDRIEAYDGDDWYRAIITDARSGEYKVHYYGYEYEYDEYVSADRIRPAQAAKQFRIGEEVEVVSDEEWYPARVLKVVGGAHLVTFEHYSDEWNEWVSSDKIRPKQPVQSDEQHAGSVN